MLAAAAVILAGMFTVAAPGINVPGINGSDISAPGINAPGMDGGAGTVLAAETEPSGTLEYENYTDLDGKTVGVMTGSIFDQVLQEMVPGALPEYFNTVPDMTSALIAGRIEAFLLDEPMARMAVRETEGINYIPEFLKEDSYAYLFDKNNGQMAEEFSAVLREFKEDGTVDEADKRWFGTDESVKVLPDVKLTGEKGKIRLAVEATTMPFTYRKDEGYVGYDIDLVMRMCERLGYDVEVIPMTFASMIPGVVSGKYDMAAGCISVTPERAQEVSFTDPCYVGGVVMMVRPTEGAAGGKSFFQSMKESFEKTFLRENRWKMIADGLGVTCLISVLSAILGSLLGFGVCMLRRAKHTGVNLIARVFVRIIQGTPLVVVLMILYYVVFTGRFSLNSVAVAVIGFSLNFAAYVSEMIRTGIEAVDPGQIEAAHAMGYNKVQTFFKITFPQAARHFLPVYRGEFISMVKMTSVVGYIAIQDLTKAGDIIRSRTYEAFFPLIATAVIYFLLSSLLASALQIAERRTDPLRRKREV